MKYIVCFQEEVCRSVLGAGAVWESIKLGQEKGKEETQVSSNGNS
jgi:hypothetical protein